jgi:hypothetical protein
MCPVENENIEGREGDSKIWLFSRMVLEKVTLGSYPAPCRLGGGWPHFGREVLFRELTEDVGANACRFSSGVRPRVGFHGNGIKLAYPCEALHRRGGMIDDADVRAKVFLCTRFGTRKSF